MIKIRKGMLIPLIIVLCGLIFIGILIWNALLFIFIHAFQLSSAYAIVDVVGSIIMLLAYILFCSFFYPFGGIRNDKQRFH